MRTTVSDGVALLGRLLLSAIFIQYGVMKALAPTATIGYFAKVGAPVPVAAYTAALVVEIAVAILFLIGLKARIAALILAVWCVATAMVAHYHPGDNAQMLHFMKNLCMAGGFLQVFAFGPGRFSVDRR